MWASGCSSGRSSSNRSKSPQKHDWIDYANNDISGSRTNSSFFFEASLKFTADEIKIHFIYWFSILSVCSLIWNLFLINNCTLITSKGHLWISFSSSLNVYSPSTSAHLNLLSHTMIILSYFSTDLLDFLYFGWQLIYKWWN